MTKREFWHGDCLELMKDIPDGSVDMILCDLPYGTTACSWDTIIPFEPLWEHYWRVLKRNGAVVLTAAQPFTSALVMSQANRFKYSIVWEKTTATGHLNAKKMPMRAHEDVIVFGRGLTTYNPQMTYGHERKTAKNVDRSKKLSDCYGYQEGVTSYDSTSRYPRSVIKTSTDKQRSSLHPTQKPVALFEYLIKTYTNPGETVLDNCAGSGTTAIAALNTGRWYICIEKDPEYYRLATERVSNHVETLKERLL